MQLQIITDIFFSSFGDANETGQLLAAMAMYLTTENSEGIRDRFRSATIREPVHSRDVAATRCP